MKNQNAKILDVRTPSEFADGHIQGAVNINYFSDQFLPICEKQIPKMLRFLFIALLEDVANKRAVYWRKQVTKFSTI